RRLMRHAHRMPHVSGLVIADLNATRSMQCRHRNVMHFGHRFDRHTGMKGLLAKLLQNAPAAHAAFKTARAETEKVVRAQPENAFRLGMLALIDAELGGEREGNP